MYSLENSELDNFSFYLTSSYFLRVGVSLLGPRVTLTVDNLRKSQSLVSRLGDYTLGNNTINSYVYIGGLPPWSVSSLMTF